jgi:hypothetical protein
MPNNPTHMLKLGLQRTTTYLDHLPLFTKAVTALMVALEAASLLPGLKIKSWGWLEPDLINLSTRGFLAPLLSPLRRCILRGGMV